MIRRKPTTTASAGGAGRRVLAGLVILLILVLGGPGWAEAKTWKTVEERADDLWSNPDNWDPTGVPGPSDIATINSGKAVVDGEFAVDLLEVGVGGAVEIVDTSLTVREIDNDGEIRLTTLGFGGVPGGILVLDGAVVYTGSGRLTASNTIGNQLARKLPGDSLTVPVGTTLKLEGPSSVGRLDVLVELRILDGGAVEYSNLTGEMPNGLTNHGVLAVQFGSSLEIRSKAESQQPLDPGQLEVESGASLTLNSAVVKNQVLIPGGPIEILGGTLDNCTIPSDVSSTTVTAPTTVVGTFGGNLHLAEGVNLSISGDVEFRGSIFADGTATISRVNNGVLLLGFSDVLSLGAGSSLLVGVPIKPDSVDASVKITEGLIRLTHPVGNESDSYRIALFLVGSDATVELVSTIHRSDLTLGGELSLQGAIDDSSIAGSGLIFGKGGTLRNVLLSASFPPAVVIEGSGTPAQSLRLEGEIRGQPEFVLNSDGGPTQLLAVGQVQLPGLTTITFNGDENRVDGFQVGDGFVVGASDTVTFVPSDIVARVEAFDFTVESGGTIEGSQLTLYELVNAGIVRASPGGSLTVRGPTDNTGGTICNNGGEVTIVSSVNGGTVQDNCEASPGGLESSAWLAGATATGSFLVDPGVGSARLIDVTSSATIEVLDGASLDLRDSFTNDGVVLVQGDLADTTLSFSLDPFTTTNEFHLNGSGELVFSDSIRNLAPTPTTTFTLFNHANTLRGAVVLGKTNPVSSQRVRLINRGRIEADGANPLVIHTGPPASLFYEVQNEGVLEVTGDGGLRVPQNELFNRGEVTIGSGSTLEVPAGFFQYLGSTELGGVMDASVTLHGGTYLGGSQPTTGSLSVFGQTRYELALDTVVPSTFRLGQEGALIVDVGGFQPRVDHDRLTANHTNLGAWVVMRNLPGFTPQVNDEFEFYEYTGSRGGEFAGILNGTSVPGLEWELLYGGSEFFGGTVTARVSGAGGSAPDLRLEIETLDNPVFPGGTVTFRHTVTNVGAGTAHAVQLELQLPAGLTLNAVTGATCEASGGMVVCPLGELGPGVQVVVDVTADIDPTATPPLVLSGTVSGLESEVGTAANTAQASSFLCTVATNELVISHTSVFTAVNEEACVSIHVGPAVDVESGGALNLRSPLVVLDEGTTVQPGGSLAARNQ